MDSVVETGLELAADLRMSLERQATDACSTLRSLSQGRTRSAAELQEKFAEALSDIDRVVIEPIPAEAGAFLVRERVLVMSEEPVARVAKAVISDYRRWRADNENTPDAAELPELIGQVFVDYLFHELRHRGQGVERFSQVQRLKAAAGAAAMARLDVLADRDGAFGYAACYSADVSRAVFLERFREALFYSVSYFFKVFPPCGTRKDKMERAIAIFLMAGRLAALDLDENTFERADLPLDAPLYVSLSDGRNALAIYRGEPSEKLLEVANDGHGLSGLIRKIERSDYDGALEASVYMLGKLRLLA